MSFSNQELQQLKSLLSSGITALEKKSREQKRVIDDLVKQKQPFKQAGTKSVVDNINETIRDVYKSRDKVTAKLAKVRALQSAVKRELVNAADEAKTQRSIDWLDEHPPRRVFHVDSKFFNSIDNPPAPNEFLKHAMDKFRGVDPAWGSTYQDLSDVQNTGYAQVVPNEPIPAVETILTTTHNFPNSWSDFKMEPAISFPPQPEVRTSELREEDVQGHRGYVRTGLRQDGPLDDAYWLRRADEARKDGYVDPKAIDSILEDYIDGNKSKESNPKDMIGSNKLPLHLWPNTATAMGCLGFLNGMLKYGRSNFRVLGIRASIYYDAAKRHLDAWFDGEECDPDDGVPHLAAALACIAIIVDAQAAGVLNDDRAVEGGYRALVDRLTPHVARLKALHADKSPYHYTIADSSGN